jgi:hypothetical protein
MTTLTAPPVQKRQPVDAPTPRRRKTERRKTADTWPRGRDDHDLLTFAIRWLPYGGGPDDEIFINFGMTRQHYLERLHEVIQRQCSRIHPTTIAQLHLLCQHPAATQTTQKPPSRN